MSKKSRYYVVSRRDLERFCHTLFDWETDNGALCHASVDYRLGGRLVLVKEVSELGENNE